MMSLIVDGQAYTGWLDARVVRSLDSFAHAFDFEYSDRWAEGDTPRPLVLGSSVQVRWENETLITGYIDSIRQSVTARSLTANASGRSKTGDLVDSSAIHQTGQWLDQTAAKIIRDLVAPFGISVEFEAFVFQDDVRVRRFDLEHGESVFSAIDRLARLRGWLPVSTPAGNLRLMRVQRAAGLRIVRLDLGECISREYSAEAQDRHSEYRLTSQTARSTGGRRAALERSVVRDAAVKRYRPLVVPSETGGAVGELQAHAQWICNTRAAGSERVAYEVVGVAAPDGLAWAPGMLVIVSDPILGVDDTLVCVSASVRVDSQNVLTQLSLARVDAYSTEPLSVKELSSKLRKL